MQILKELRYVLDRPQKVKAVGVIIAVFFSSVFELMGVAMILPFIQVILTPEKVMSNPIVARIMDVLGITSSTTLLMLMGLGLIALYLIKDSYIIWSYYIQYNYATLVQKQLSIKMLRSYMRRPYEFFLDTNSSVVLRGCENDTTGVYVILSGLFTILVESLSMLMIGAYLICTDAIIAIGILLIMALVLWGVLTLFKPKVKRMGVKSREISALKNKSIYQAVNGIKEIFVMQRMSYFTEEYEDASDQYRKIKRTYDTLNASPDRIIEGICVSGIIGIVCVRLVMSDADMAAFVPKLGAFAMAAFKIFPSVGKIAGRMTNIIYQRPALTGVYNNIKEANAYAEKQQIYIAQSDTRDKITDSLKFHDRLTISHVAWKYKNQKNDVLSDVCIEIEKGQSIGLVGPSGSGKTTLSDIVLGLMHPRQGMITMDGIDIYSMPEQWARIVGYVPQAVFLIDDSVRNNIAFGLPKDQVQDEMIWQALAQAQLKDFVLSLPSGLDTIVGERGVKFSGGQKQRIAIARALYHRPEILVLDEATAALDNETETAVMESIDALQGQITMIIVAHRLTTIRNCDKIYRIDGGIAVEKSKQEVLGGN